MFYSSINENLPTTSYVKMIDIWLLFNLMKPFVDIMVQTYVETMRVHPDEVEADKEDEVKADKEDIISVSKSAWAREGKPGSADTLRQGDYAG